VAYCLGIYLLNLFLAFLQPKFDPSLTQDEGLEDGGPSDGDGRSALPTKQDEEFRPFIRRLPEFKFWYSATRMVVGCIVATFFEVFDLPVFWPVLVVYWLILFSLTSESCSALGVSEVVGSADRWIVRRQIQHMIKYRYVPFSIGKAKYGSRSS
jgi:Rer1 family